MELTLDPTDPTTSPPVWRQRAVIEPVAIRVAAISMSGVALGMVTQIMRGELSNGWGVFAHADIVWALAAFCVGAAMPSVRAAAFGGAAQLLIAASAYFVSLRVLDGGGAGTRSLVVWPLAGVAVGAVFAIAGFVTRHSPRWRHTSIVLVAGALIAEGLHLTLLVGNPGVHQVGMLAIVAAALVAAWCVVVGTRRSTLLAILAASFGVTLLTGTLLGAFFTF